MDSTNTEAERKHLLSQLREVKSIVNEIAEAESEINSHQRDLKRIKAESQKKANNKLIWGFVYIVSGIIGFFVVGIIATFGGLLESNEDVHIIITFLGIPLGIALCYMLTKSRRALRAEIYFLRRSDPIKEALDIKNAELDALMTESVVDFVPPDYRNVEAIGQICKLIENQRADTLKEALNLYEDIRLKSKVDDLTPHQSIVEIKKKTYSSLEWAIAGLIFAFLLPIVAYPCLIIGFIMATKDYTTNKSIAAIFICVIGIIIAIINSYMGAVMGFFGQLFM